MLKISNYNSSVNMLQQLGASPSSGKPRSLTAGAPVVATQQAGNVSKPTFANELSQASGVPEASQSKEIQFSKHALARIHSRKLEMTPAKLAELSTAMDKAQSKGAKETLILTDDAAFVVSPATRTVISAFDRDNLREGVFTSIDSAVIL